MVLGTLHRLIGVALTVLVHEARELLAVANGLQAGRMSNAPQER